MALFIVVSSPSDVVLELRDSDGTLYSTTATDALGFYSFTPLNNLRAGKSFVITLPIDQVSCSLGAACWRDATHLSLATDRRP